MAVTPEARNTTTMCSKINRNIVRVWKIFDTITSGKPDTEFLRRDGKEGSVLKVEFKYLKELPVRDTTLVAPKWQNDLQREWLGNYWDCNGHALAIIFVATKPKTQCIVFANKKEWETGLPKSECERRMISMQACADLVTFIVTKGEFGALPPHFKLGTRGLELV